MVERVRSTFYWPTVSVACVACVLLVSAFLWGPPQHQAAVLTILDVLSQGEGEVDGERGGTK